MRAWSPAEGLHAIVLAAGGSSRLGSPKQLIEVQGRPLVRRYVDMANALCGRQVVVVTGAAQRAVESMLAGVGATMIPNPDWQIGLSTSVRTGLRALQRMLLARCSCSPIRHCCRRKVSKD
jgi:molybdenum cofactor cytidylyltransferase